MNSTERVTNAILGKPVDRTPVYGWVSANLSGPITEQFGSVENFEDHYQFDMAHLHPVGAGAAAKGTARSRNQTGFLAVKGLMSPRTKFSCKPPPRFGRVCLLQSSSKYAIMTAVEGI